MIRAKLKHHYVQSLLLRKGISQNDLAKRVEITSGYCSQLLSGIRCPSAGVRIKLMKELNADFDTLFDMIQTPEEHHAEAA